MILRSRSNEKTRRNRSRGYTAVELLMAIGIFAIGITGVAAMQKVTSSSNAHAKNLAIAASVAQGWQEMLAVDALIWTNSQPDVSLANTTWLNGVTANDNVWVLPAENATATFGPAFDARGSFVNQASPEAVFCTHVRLTRLINTPASGLVRTEVRVFWPKEGQVWNAGADYCDAGANPAVIGAATQNFHFVYNTTAVRQTPN